MLAPKPLVAVVWDDAYGDVGGEATAEDTARDFHRPEVYTTFGLLLVEDERGVTVASDYRADSQTYRGRTFIPRGMITTIHRLGLPKAPKPRRRPPEPPDAPTP